MINRQPGSGPDFSVACRDEAYCAVCQALARIIGFDAEYGAVMAEELASGTLVHNELQLTVDFFAAVSQWVSIADPAEQDVAEELNGTAWALRQVVQARELAAR